MRVAIYQLDGGKIIRRGDCSESQAMLQVQEGEELYLNCPEDATHIVDNEPVNLSQPPAPPTTEELLDLMRPFRNLRLSACDWTQLPDADLTAEQRSAWQIYRQALRDFPETCDPANPVWPTPPA